MIKTLCVCLQANGHTLCLRRGYWITAQGMVPHRVRRYLIDGREVDSERAEAQLADWREMGAEITITEESFA